MIYSIYFIPISMQNGLFWWRKCICMYVSILKIEMVQVQASPLPWQAEVTVREVDMRVIGYTRCKIFHKLAFKTFKVSLIWNITRISTVKLVFSCCANAKFKDITCIVNHHYHVFHVPWRFYSKSKSCSIVFQLHMITDYVSIVYLVTRWHCLGGG